MSRELWAVEPCDHGENMSCDRPVIIAREEDGGYLTKFCPGGGWVQLDFDAVWGRYYETANRRFESGLTYNELWFVVYGEKKEEDL